MNNKPFYPKDLSDFECETWWWATAAEVHIPVSYK